MKITDEKLEEILKWMFDQVENLDYQICGINERFHGVNEAILNQKYYAVTYEKFFGKEENE